MSHSGHVALWVMWAAGFEQQNYRRRLFKARRSSSFTKSHQHKCIICRNSVKMSKNDWTFVIYFAELGIYIIPNVLNNVCTQKNVLYVVARRYFSANVTTSGWAWSKFDSGNVSIYSRHSSSVRPPRNRQFLASDGARNDTFPPSSSSRQST